jgi:hypothetical protein
MNIMPPVTLTTAVRVIRMVHSECRIRIVVSIEECTSASVLGEYKLVLLKGYGGLAKG